MWLHFGWDRTFRGLPHVNVWCGHCVLTSSAAVNELREIKNTKHEIIHTYYELRSQNWPGMSPATLPKLCLQHEFSQVVFLSQKYFFKKVQRVGETAVNSCEQMWTYASNEKKKVSLGYRMDLLSKTKWLSNRTLWLNTQLFNSP